MIQNKQIADNQTTLKSLQLTFRHHAYYI